MVSRVNFGGAEVVGRRQKFDQKKSVGLRQGFAMLSLGLFDLEIPVFSMSGGRRDRNLWNF